jgi:O-antigen ligase
MSQALRVRQAHRWIDLAGKAAWVLFLISLPVTSFPFFPNEFGGGTLVRPLSIYPLIALVILVVLPRLFGRPLPKTLVSFLPFVLVALASTLLASLQGIEPSQGISVMARMLRAVVTLGFGAAVYFTVSIMPLSEEDLRASLRWLYAGFAIALFWGSLQAIYVVHYTDLWFDLLSKIQDFVSIRHLFVNRISGLTYEPNWFADQISFLLLPWLLSSVLTGYSVFRRRWRWVTIETFLLVWAIGLLPFTYSRAGLGVMLVLVVLSVLFFRGRRQLDRARSTGQRALRRSLEILLLLLLLAGGIYFAGTKNAFFARIWDYWQRKPDEGVVEYVLGYFDYLGFGARFTYWQTAYNMFADYPVFGVGLGNYAFYFEEELPDRPLVTQPEVLHLVVPEKGRNRLVTSKNFFLRVLAETGLAGAAAFMAFFVAVIGCALYLWLDAEQNQRFWGTAGLLGVISFLMVSFSFDSFAIPNLWVVFGLVTAAANVFMHEPGPALTYPEALQTMRC